jgi:hypothetical protein
MSKITDNCRVCCCFLVLCTLLLFTGCAEKNYNMNTNTDSNTDSQDEIPMPSTSVGSYPDIELPSDMKWDGRGSMAINTDSFSGGILKYSGRVETNSLKDFMIASMKKHQWRHVGEASYRNMLLAFTKPNKTCMAIISEGFGGSYGLSYITLYVTVDKIAAKGSSYDEPTKSRGMNSYNEPAKSKGVNPYSEPVKSKGNNPYDDQMK